MLPNGFELPAPWPCTRASWTGSLPWPVRPGARVRARRGGRDLYSMEGWMAGKCAFTLRRKPRRQRQQMCSSQSNSGCHSNRGMDLEET
jgi:hypothetical protein